MSSYAMDLAVHVKSSCEVDRLQPFPSSPCSPVDLSHSRRARTVSTNCFTRPTIVRCLLESFSNNLVFEVHLRYAVIAYFAGRFHDSLLKVLVSAT